MTDAIVLPESGDGSRRTRRQPTPRQPRARPPRRRRWLFVVLLVALIAGGAAVYIVRDDGGTNRAATSPRTAAATVKTGLLIQRSSDGALSGVTLLVDRGRGGDVMFLPPGTMVQAPSLGLVPLRDTLDAGVPDLLRSTVENLLGTRVDAVTEVTVDQLADAVRPASPLRVEVPATVERRTGDRIATVFEPGPTDLSSDQLGDYLDLPAATDLDRLVRHQSFWEAWLASVKRGRSAPEG